MGLKTFMSACLYVKETWIPCYLEVTATEITLKNIHRFFRVSEDDKIVCINRSDIYLTYFQHQAERN